MGLKCVLIVEYEEDQPNGDERLVCVPHKGLEFLIILTSKCLLQIVPNLNPLSSKSINLLKF